MGLRVTRVTCFHRASFGLPRPFRSRVRSRHATDRQTDTASHFTMLLRTEVAALFLTDIQLRRLHSKSIKFYRVRIIPLAAVSADFLAHVQLLRALLHCCLPLKLSYCTVFEQMNVCKYACMK